MTQRAGQEGSFELRSPSGCGGLTEDGVNPRAFRSRANNKGKQVELTNK